MAKQEGIFGACFFLTVRERERLQCSSQPTSLIACCRIGKDHTACIGMLRSSTCITGRSLCSLGHPHWNLVIVTEERE